MKEVQMARSIDPYRQAVPTDADSAPWAATVAMRSMVMGWIHRGPAAALVFAALGLLLGLLSRHHLPTRSIFDLMLSHPG
jgi:hypothetical protein